MTLWESIVAALKSGAWKSWVVTALSAAVSFGLLDSEQATLINNIVASLATLAGIVISLVHTFHAAKLHRQVAKSNLPSAA